MKQFRVFSLMILGSLVLGACSTSNDVVGGGIFQKRKYTGGVYWDRTEKLKSTKENGEEEFDIFRSEEENQRKYVSTTTIRTDEPVYETNTDAIVASVDGVQDLSLSTTNSRSEVSSDRTEELTSEENLQVPEKKNKVKLLTKKKPAAPSGGDAMFILAIIFAILIPPVGVLIHTNIDWMKVLICLLLCLLFFLPGMIYALLVVFDVI